MSYYKNPRLNQSLLKKILDGPDEFWHAKNNPKEPTESMKLGQAVHTLVLEPHNSATLLKRPNISSSTREGKIFNFLASGKSLNFFPLTTRATKKQEEGLFYEVDTREFDFAQEMLEKFSGYFKTPENFLALSETDYDKAQRMAENVFKNSDCRALLSGCTAMEKEIDYDYNYIPMKAKLDGIAPDYVLDLKTTGISLSDPYYIRKEISSPFRRYDFQAASYLVASQTPNLREYFILFVRSEAPYSVRPIRLDEVTVENGFNLFDQACEIYNDCLLNNPQFIANYKTITI